MARSVKKGPFVDSYLEKKAEAAASDKKPIVSEKSNDLRELSGKYSFQVCVAATKADVKKAVAKLWGVEVKSVSTAIRRDKVRRRGAFVSKPGLSKRAIVTLKSGQKLPLFEDQ